MARASLARPPADRPRLARYLATFALGAGAAALAVHHAGLLAGRLLDRSILDPTVALRWSLAALLLAGLLALHRHGVRFDRAPAACAATALVLLLHLVAGAPALHQPEVAPTGLLTILPVGLVAVGLLEVLRRTIRCGRTPLPRARRGYPPEPATTRRSRLASSPWAARPPPSVAMA